MLTTVVVTLFGADRPGLVEAVAALVRESDGNWVESRMLHLGGHFAGIVRIEVEEDSRAKLLAALKSPGVPELNIVAHPAGESAPADSADRPGRRVALEIVGHDRPGIVRAVAHILAKHGVNVEELETERTSAPMTGEPIFQARAEVTLPDGLDIPLLQAELERIAADLMVDLIFRSGGKVE